MKLKRILFIPDTHRPYHDKLAWKLVMKVARHNKYNILIVGGDFGEFYVTNGHRKDPNKHQMLEMETDDINAGLDELDALGVRRKIYLEGNHENNLSRYLADHAPELFNMVKVENILRLKERGWEFYPYKRKKARIGKLTVTHDLGNAGRNAIEKAIDGFQDNIVINHTHRMKYIIEGNYSGIKHVAASFGWLGDVSQIEYTDQEKARKEWALGFGEGYMTDKGVVFLTPIPIVDYSCVVSGKYYCVR